MISILLMDDQVVRKEFLSRILDKNNTSITHCLSVKDGIEKIKNEHFDLIMIDHDLGGKSTTLPFVDFLDENSDENLLNSVFIIHSLNPVGAENIEKLLRKKFRNVFRLPFLCNENFISTITVISNEINKQKTT